MLSLVIFAGPGGGQSLGCKVDDALTKGETCRLSDTRHKARQPASCSRRERGASARRGLPYRA